MIKITLIILLILLLCNLLVNSVKPVRETFSDNEKFIYKNNDLYDDFYTGIYDNLVYNSRKNEFEVDSIMKHMNMKHMTNGMALDIGSGTGYHVDQFTQKGLDCIGIDSSKSMITKAKVKFPTQEFMHANVLKPMNFQPKLFDLITCLYFTVYYIKDKEQLFNNISLWLKPGGIFVLHMVDKHKFNPMIPAGDPFVVISPQNYTDKRINDTVVYFDSFKYKSNFALPGKDKGVFKEYFKFKDSNKVRQNDHMFYMENQKTILQLVKNVGMTLEEVIDMAPCAYEHQYLYVFKKSAY
jgi:ubiquinone/menaquinone biosynthesis C-methylase UbiE